MAEAPPDIDEGYRVYRPMLFGALARFAERGVVFALDEGLDIIHDFFIDEYDDLRSRFDPTRGRFTTLVFAAFVRYASGRIPRLRRWNDSLTGDAELHGDESGDATFQRDEAAIHAALSGIPADARAVLHERFAVGVSEREIARRLGASRHSVRERLMRALALLAIRMGERADLSERDWKIMRALWGQDRSVFDVAAEHSLTAEQVRRVSQRALQRFATALQKAP
jgi:RNA polymerase sigma factor (sigma-70 family)